MLNSGPGFVEENLTTDLHREVKSEIQSFICNDNDEKGNSPRKILGRIEANAFKTSVKGTGKYWVRKENTALYKTHADKSLSFKER